MSDITLIKKGDIINFDMIAPGIFGDQYKSAIVSSVAPYTLAKLVDPSLDVKHANFYPFFKDQVDNVNSPSVYDYFILQLDKTKSEFIAIGFPWINSDSLKTIATRYATIQIQNFQEIHRAPVLDLLNSLNTTYTFVVTDEQ